MTRKGPLAMSFHSTALLPFAYLAGSPGRLLEGSSQSPLIPQDEGALG